jgi:predicted component of type VI protein secretion system
LNKITLKYRTATVVLMAAMILAACSSIPPPTAQMAVAESAIQRANTADTRTGAPGELQIAIAKLTSARAAFERKDYLLAGQLAQQTQVDAELAEALAQARTADVAAQETQAAARALRDELNR